MLRQHNADLFKKPFAVRMLRPIHLILACYGVAIICIVFWGLAENVLPQNTSFAVAVGAPMALASLFSWAAASFRIFFGAAAFFCTFLTVTLAALPFLTAVHFPLHFVVYSLAGVYALSLVILIRFSLTPS